MAIDIEDVRIDIARPDEPGASAVRVTHIPTGITVVASDEATVAANRATAMDRLDEAVTAALGSEATQSTPPDPGGAEGPDAAKARVGRTFTAASATYDGVIGFFAPFGRALVAAADLRPGERVLDVASGRGASLLPAAEAVGPTGSVRGVDLAPGMVDRLAADLADRGVVNATVRQGDAEQLDGPDASFDAVLGGFMIFFPPHPDDVLREMHRILRPGGRVALSIFDGPAGFPFQADLLAAVGAEDGARGPAGRFNKASVLDPALERAGFVDVHGIEVVERYVFADAAQVEEWQRSLGLRVILEGLDDERLERYRRLLAERLEDHRVDAGFELRQRIRISVARRPG